MKRKKTPEALRYRMLAAWPLADEGPDSDLTRQRVDALRVAHEQGNRSAVVLALRFLQPREAFRDELMPVPVWLLDLAVTALEDEARGVKPERGRHARPAAELLDDYVDLVRAHHVMLARADGHRGAAAFDAASVSLEGSAAWATANTLETAFKRFQRRRRTEPWRYAGLPITLPEG